MIDAGQNLGEKVIVEWFGEGGRKEDVILGRRVEMMAQRKGQTWEGGVGLMGPPLLNPTLRARIESLKQDFLSLHQ